MHARRTGVVAAMAVGLSSLSMVAPTPARADAPVPARSFTMAVTGDILAHDALNARARAYGGGITYDYQPMFTDIQPLIAGADLAICHLEGPIAPPGVKYTGQPVFASPPDIAASIAGVGYDRCSTASNHSLDRGTGGVTATLDAFDAAGLGHSGTARTPEEAVAPILDVNGVAVAHLAYSYGFNGGRRPPAGQPWWANVIDPATIVADAFAARARGAEFVVVSLHWGSEFRTTPTAAQRQVAQVLTASGAIDLIVGHHSHVVQPIERINGKWVIFGLGNIVSNQRPATGLIAASQDGVVVRLAVTDGPGGLVVGTPEATATWVNEDGYRALDVAAQLQNPSLSAVLRSRLKASIRRTSTTVGAYLTSHGDSTPFTLTPIDASAGYFLATGTCPVGTTTVEYTWVNSPGGVGRGLIAQGPGAFSLALRMLASGPGEEISVIVRCNRSTLSWLTAWGAFKVMSGNALLPVPADSGTGRRIVYSVSAQQTWIIEAGESVARTYLVSGRRLNLAQRRPQLGTFSVLWKKQSWCGGGCPKFVAFRRGTEAWIGFHVIPKLGKKGSQTIAQLGEPLSNGCPRQDPVDAQWLYDWAQVGDAVVVVA